MKKIVSLGFVLFFCFLAFSVNNTFVSAQESIIGKDEATATKDKTEASVLEKNIKYYEKCVELKLNRTDHCLEVLKKVCDEEPKGELQKDCSDNSHIFGMMDLAKNSNLAAHHEIQIGEETITVGRALRFSDDSKEQDLAIFKKNGKDESKTRNLFDELIYLGTRFLGTIAIICFLIAGYFFLFSNGDEGKIARGKEIILYTSVGIITIIGSYLLVQFIISLFSFTL